MTLKAVKATRRVEAESAAEAPGARDLQSFDLGDCPLGMDPETMDGLVDVIRTAKPAFMLCDSRWDPYNTDPIYATRKALEAPMIAQARGHRPLQRVLGAPQLHLFEPHQTEPVDWKPDEQRDTSPVRGRQRAVIECMRGQEHLRDDYTSVAANCGNPFRRNSCGLAGGLRATHAKGFQAISPRARDEL